MKYDSINVDIEPFVDTCFYFFLFFDIFEKIVKFSQRMWLNIKKTLPYIEETQKHN